MPSFDALCTPRSTGASFPTIYEETTASELSGFPDILRGMIQNLLATTQRPRYTVYHRELSPSQTQYWAIVRIFFARPDGNQSFEITGRVSSTSAMAINMAAWESIARVPHLAQVPDQRAYYYYPRRETFDGQTAFNCPFHETDPAVVHLVSYLFALDNLFDTLEQELQATRVTFAFLQLQSPVSTSAPPSPPLLGLAATDYEEGDHRSQQVTHRELDNPSTSDATNAETPPSRPAHLDVEQVD